MMYLMIEQSKLFLIVFEQSFKIVHVLTHGFLHVRAWTTTVVHVPVSVAVAKHVPPTSNSGAAVEHGTGFETWIWHPEDTTLMMLHGVVVKHGFLCVTTTPCE